MAKVEYPSEVRSLVGELKRLPGVGPRSAERIAVYLLQNPKAAPMDLSSALKDCHEIVKACATCGFFTGQSGCAVCSEQGRNTQIICVVEQPTDVLPIERSGVFRGLYHCLGGKLSPLDDVRPEDLRIGELVRRVRENPGTEVILATSSDVEGEATANYLDEVLESSGCRVTRLAQGLPAGGGLEFADELTLSRAFEGRR
ncbi:recombination mediator RecR [bacterium]|nr:recombination mediator RecR [Akkermansiaceae bacterium]MDA7502599.1 recombination mediator RecR [bacterium]MDA7501095.1 recombination mediator RecR [Akkermansiaceae bacterium]MDA7528945.1 recombination mediator RecR [Akkermansiaceae bacterium]MDA7540214.1 recombination mediator RecR [Akkermansiaceae bacterium]